MTTSDIRSYAQLIHAVVKSRDDAFAITRANAQSSARLKRQRLCDRLRPLLDVLQSAKADRVLNDRLYIFNEDGPFIYDSGTVNSWPNFKAKDSYAQVTCKVQVSIDPDTDHVVLSFMDSTYGTREVKPSRRAADAVDLVPELITLLADASRQRDMI